MSATIKGKVIHVGSKETVGANNKEKQLFVIETDGQYPKKVAFEAWGNTVQYSSKLKRGDEVEVSYDVESREHKEKWYTQAKAFKIQLLNPSSTVTGSTVSPPSDDLPF